MEYLCRCGEVRGVGSGSALHSWFKKIIPVSVDCSEEGIEEEIPKMKPPEVLIYPLRGNDRTVPVIDHERILL